MNTGVYTESGIDDLKRAVSIVDVVSRYVDLKPDGSGRMKGLCPFHSEKTPSFIVNTSGKDEGTFHCFGCSKHGDIIDFIQAVEHLDGPGAAVRFIQEHYLGGSPAGLRRPSPGSARKPARIEQSEPKPGGSSFGDIYTAFLSLLDDPQPDGYLTQARGVTVDTLKRNGVKQISAARQQTIKKDMAEMFPVDRLKACGLFPTSGKTGKTYFVFWSCDYVYSFHDQAGQLVYLQGVNAHRGPGPDGKKPPKYIYLSGIIKPVLYLPADFSAWRPGDDLIITEAALDALSAVDLGLKAVAIPDTGGMKKATAADLEPLRPFKCVIIGDNDKAGYNGSAALFKTMTLNHFRVDYRDVERFAQAAGISAKVKDFNDITKAVRGTAQGQS